jgi:uncharacterized protein
MPLLVNLRHLQARNAQLQGELSVEELDIDSRDEVIQVKQALQYELEVQTLEDGLLVHGRLRLILDCQCVRCLKTFRHPLKLEDWTCHVPLEGEEKAAVVNDCVDLTPYAREDILLEFPRHPLCKPDCPGLPKLARGKAKNTRGTGKTAAGSSAWAELNKLKF